MNKGAATHMIITSRVKLLQNCAGHLRKCLGNCGATAVPIVQGWLDELDDTIFELNFIMDTVELKGVAAVNKFLESNAEQAYASGRTRRNYDHSLFSRLIGMAPAAEPVFFSGRVRSYSTP